MGKYRKMLSDWEAPYIQSLVSLIVTQSKTTLLNWALDYAEQVILPLWHKYHPKDGRPQKALAAARAWQLKEIKLTQAKPIILDCHAAARESASNPVAQAAARAIGQCASAIHSIKHCIGLVLYGPMAIAYDKIGIDASWERLEQCAAVECNRMLIALKKNSVDNEQHPAPIYFTKKHQTLC